MTRKLGEAQIGTLYFLKQFGGWDPRRANGWNWITPSGTRRILDSLVARGLVRVVGEVYKAIPDKKGRK